MSMQIKKYALCAVTGALLFSTQAQAESQWFGSVGYDTGGERMIWTISSSGSVDKSIRTNGGVHADIGVLIPYDADRRMETQLSLGIKYKSLETSTGNATYTTFPLEILQAFNTENLRLAGGFTIHLAPKVSTSGSASAYALDFNTAVGLVAQAEYRFTHQLSAGLRYTAISYTIKGSSINLIGNGVGLIMTAMF